MLELMLQNVRSLRCLGPKPRASALSHIFFFFSTFSKKQKTFTDWGSVTTEAVRGDIAHIFWHDAIAKKLVR
jgi:hypothetical protein